MGATVESATSDQSFRESGALAAVFDAITCPIIITLLCVCGILVYIYCRPLLRPKKKLKPIVPKMAKRDFTLEELQSYDGNGKDKRILIAVNGKVFDVTTNGQEFYGKGAPYASFAGRDASRALACFDIDERSLKIDYDDLSDLKPDQMNTLREWELQFSERYDHVGRLLKPGEPHRVYEIDQDAAPNNQDLIVNKQKVN